MLPTIPQSPFLEIAVEQAIEPAFFGEADIDQLIERIEEETTPIFAGQVDEAELQREAEEEAEREASGEGESEEEREREEAEEREREAEEEGK